MNKKILSVIAATTLMVGMGMVHATPPESLIQMDGVENGWLVTPAVDGIGGTTALPGQMVVSEKASSAVAPNPIICPPKCPSPPPCPKGKVCPTPKPPQCCIAGRPCPRMPIRCPIVVPVK